MSQNDTFNGYDLIQDIDAMPDCLNDSLVRLEVVLGHISFPLLLFSVAAIAANGLMIYVLCKLIKNRRVSYKRFYLILNTSIMDSLGSIIITVISCIHINKRFSSNRTFINDIAMEIAQLATTIVVMAPAVYYLSLCLVQYIAVLHPIFYALRVTKRVIFSMIAFQWLCLLFTVGIAVVKFMSSRQEAKDNPGLYFYTAVTYEYYRIIFVALFALAIIVVYGIVLFKILVTKKQTERTLKSFIKSFGFNISLYLIVSTAMLVLSSIQFRPYLRYLSNAIKTSAPTFYKKHLDGADDISVEETMLQVCHLLHLKYYEAIVNSLWLSRLLIDPILHFSRHAILRRSLSCAIYAREQGDARQWFDLRSGGHFHFIGTRRYSTVPPSKLASVG